MAANARLADSVIVPSTNIAPFEGTYFDESKNSTPETTPSATPSINSDDSSRIQVSKPTNLPLPVLMRDFPKPTAEVNVEAALERQPGRWTVQGQIAANEQRAKQALLNEEAAKAKRTRDFEATKRDLLAGGQSVRALRLSTAQ